MKKLLLLAIIGFSAAAFAQDEIYYPEYENSVSFYASFDAATADADISEGRERPIAVLGKLKFVDGLRGKLFSAEKAEPISAMPERTISRSSVPELCCSSSRRSIGKRPRDPVFSLPVSNLQKAFSACRSRAGLKRSVPAAANCTPCSYIAKKCPERLSAPNSPVAKLNAENGT